MSDTNNSEIHTLRDSLITISYEENPFVFSWKDGKDITAVIAPNTSDPNIITAQLITSAKSIYDTILDLDQKIKISLTVALNYVQASPKIQKSPFDAQSNEMYLARYFVENAVFRTMSVWDALAHLTNIWLQIDNPEAGEDSKNINSRNFFARKSNEYESIDFLARVETYFEEDDNTDSEPWSGNHQYVRAFRNSLTHRNAPSITGMNIRTTADIEKTDSPLLNFRLPIMFDLYRIINDYIEASKFVSELVRLMIDPD